MRMRIDELEYSLSTVAGKLDSVLVKLEIMETVKEKRKQMILQNLDKINQVSWQSIISLIFMLT